MVMKPEPLLAAIRAAHARLPPGSPRVYLSAQGERFAQREARELAALPGLLLVAGRYEGVDERVVELGIDRELSVGDYVLSGGELPALMVIDAVARLLPGALGDERSSVEESFIGRAARLAALHAAGSVRGPGGAAGAAVGRSRRHPPLAPGSRRWRGRWRGGRTCSRALSSRARRRGTEGIASGGAEPVARAAGAAAGQDRGK